MYSARSVPASACGTKFRPFADRPLLTDAALHPQPCPQIAADHFRRLPRDGRPAPAVRAFAELPWCMACRQRAPRSVRQLIALGAAVMVAAAGCSYSPEEPGLLGHGRPTLTDTDELSSDGRAAGGSAEHGPRPARRG